MLGVSAFDVEHNPKEWLREVDIILGISGPLEFAVCQL